MSGPTGARDLGMMPDRELLDLVDRAQERVVWAGVLASATSREQIEVARRVLGERATVGALDGLAASAQLVELVTGSRWILMRQAREDGASWEQVGAAVGLPGEQARSWYAQKVDAHARHTPEFFDTPRDRAVLDDAANDDTTTARGPEAPAAEAEPARDEAVGDEAAHAAEDVDDDGAGW